MKSLPKLLLNSVEFLLYFLSIQIPKALISNDGCKSFKCYLESFNIVTSKLGLIVIIHDTTLNHEEEFMNKWWYDILFII